jgi:transposase-like protein
MTEPRKAKTYTPEFRESAVQLACKRPSLTVLTASSRDGLSQFRHLIGEVPG